MTPMEPWERVWIDAETFSADQHSNINCTVCHQGQLSSDMETAHDGLVSRPSQNPEAVCAECHQEITDASVNSLHNTLAGYDTALYERSLPENHQIIEEMESYHCDSCHASCGDCHVSQPASVGGGLVEGHVFRETPSMSQNCTACHGSRVKDEYYGAHEGISSDVHFKARMPCTDCHTSNEMHGIDMGAAHRYDGAEEPSCIGCHADAFDPEVVQIEQHEIHGTDLMSCQVCHSDDYINCTNCHVERTEENVAFFSVQENWTGFYIGFNPDPTDERPWDYVPVRHVPIDINSFSFYGEDLLPNFDDRPTWAYATPHNIQRETPQNRLCTNCHGNDDIFLTKDKVDPAELEANEDVIVDKAPTRRWIYSD